MSELIKEAQMLLQKVPEGTKKYTTNPRDWFSVEEALRVVYLGDQLEQCFEYYHESLLACHYWARIIAIENVVFNAFYENFVIIELSRSISL